MRADLEQLARRQLADYDAARPGTVFGEAGFALTVAEAYELQFRVAALRQKRGERVAGYKVGCVSKAVQTQLGLAEPVFGHLFANEVHQSGVLLDPARFEGLAIEGEFALRIAEDIPDAAWLLAGPQRAVAGGFAVMELHNCVFRAPDSLRAPELIANNAIHAGIVFPLDDALLDNAAELADERIRVIRNGETLGRATGRALPGGPLASLAWLVDRLQGFGKMIRRGQVVLTGSPLPLYPVAAGDRLEIRCSRLPPVTARVAPAQQ